ncbi:MAG: hypothetical protein FWC91_05760 [Defluviitaleaceae bacterium]|nr:hypothetical protein [Defluviitaleaceae bacterium]
MNEIFTGLLAMLLFFGAGYEVSEHEYSLFPIVTTVAGTGSHGDVDGDPAQFNLPASVFSGEDGGLYVLDTYNNLIRKIDAYGSTRRIAGDILAIDFYRFPHGFHKDGPVEDALFYRPTAGVIDSEGRMFIVDSNNHAIRVIIEDDIFTFAGGVEPGHADGHLREALFYNPTAMVMDGRGNMFITDTGNNVIRRIDANGYVTTIAGVVGQYGFNDGLARRALFNEPMGIAVNEDGVIFVADTGNHLIRTIENGQVNTLAGVFSVINDEEVLDEWDEHPIGGFVDGNLREAMFHFPVGLALWEDVLIVADTSNNAVRAILPQGEVLTIVGTGYAGYVDGLLNDAMLHMPRGVYVFEDELIIIDTGNNMIRKITLVSADELARADDITEVEEE